ncbi:unnamed protein product [Symbiodinium sp. KB8]|nr:unnamed protein product [Symbiodinium sp. KB8]
MVRVRWVSGEDLARISDEELTDVESLKKRLRVETGVPRCLQQLVHEGRRLDDTEEIREGMEVHLILHLSSVESVGCELQDAAAKGRAKAVRLLLDAGLDADFTAEADGQTALMLASGNGHEEVVRLLLEAGAAKDLMYPKTHGHTALMLASAAGHAGVVGLLMEAAADPALRGRHGHTALMLASLSGRAEVLRLLLEASPAKDLQDVFGQSALMSASHAGHTAAVGLLLEAGAAKNLRNNMGRNTALMLAASAGHAGVVHLLLKAGADQRLEDDTGISALMLASWGGHTEVVRLLEADRRKGQLSCWPLQDATRRFCLCWPTEQGSQASSPDPAIEFVPAGYVKDGQGNWACVGCRGGLFLLLGPQQNALAAKRRQAGDSLQDMRRDAGQASQVRCLEGLRLET